MKKLYSNKLVIFSLVLPGILVFLFAVLSPICLSIYYGFTDYTGMGKAQLIGWDNYIKLFHDGAFGRSIKNSLLLAIGFICIQHPLAIVVAAVLDKLQGKAEGVFRCIYFIPNVISVAVIAYLWKFIYNPDFGLLNNILKAFGYQGQINWLSQQKIKRILTVDEPEELNHDARLWMNYAPMKIIQDMVAIDGQIKTVAIYPENGINPYLSCVDRSSYIGDMEQVRKQEIYALAIQEKGKFLWQRVGRYESDTYQFNQGDKIVMYREIYDMARRNKLGYLVIGSSAEIFDEICQNSLRDRREAVVIMSEYGAELVRCGNINDTVISDILAEKTLKITDQKLIQGNTWGNYNVYCCRDEETGTMVYKIVHKVGWKDLSNAVIYAPLALLIGFLFGLYPVLLLVSNIVSKPLHTLSAAMENFKQGDFSQKIEAITQDEVGEVSACFNRMVDDIRELIDKNYILAIKERESELDILQAQINPHFLYNTLDSLYWKAMESENEEIAEDILSLSQLFRLVLNRGDGIVTVQTEAELLDRYLHIQQMRFGKRLKYEILLDEAILGEEIPKLILQPFVENAIVHGFENADRNYSLSIIGKREDAFMTFQIEDTGVGMSEEQMEAIWDKAGNCKYASQRIGRYAIKNVKERLELIYHENYTLRIMSRVGQGTTVVVSVPCGLKEIRQHEH
ncbi:multiple sugar transport system permease [Lachnospiraceae bacterium 10-1]|nr:multiple sugar transport system permease [Lachnospiraceae bacterium 10-1]